MLSPARKLLWKARREQRKLKLKLTPIIEEEEDFVEENGITSNISEEMRKFCAKDHLEVCIDEQILYQPLVKTINTGGKKEKEKLLFLCNSCQYVTQPQNRKITCKDMKIQTHYKKKVSKYQQKHMKIPKRNQK